MWPCFRLLPLEVEGPFPTVPSSVPIDEDEPFPSLPSFVMDSAYKELMITSTEEARVLVSCRGYFEGVCSVLGFSPLNWRRFWGVSGEVVVEEGIGLLFIVDLGGFNESGR